MQQVVVSFSLKGVCSATQQQHFLLFLWMCPTAVCDPTALHHINFIHVIPLLFNVTMTTSTQQHQHLLVVLLLPSGSSCCALLLVLAMTIVPATAGAAAHRQCWNQIE
jgi:hypothetical protein